jgi:hypothetical protein
MNSEVHTQPLHIITLIILLILLGLGGLGGGVAMLIDPSGQMMGLPTDMLVNRIIYAAAVALALALLISFRRMTYFFSMRCWNHQVETEKERLAYENPLPACIDPQG